MSRTLNHINIVKMYELPFMCLAEGLEKHIAGQKFVAIKTTIPAVRRFFLPAYEGARYNGNLPELKGKYQKAGGSRRLEFKIHAMVKLKELYQRATGVNLENEREIGIAAVRFLGLLDNLENQPSLNVKERQQYGSLLQFNRTLLQDPESQKMRR